MSERLECIDERVADAGTEDACEGAVEFRTALSGTGVSFPRCDKHWEQRMETQLDINSRYPQQQPSDFDPTYAGERWDEDY